MVALYRPGPMQFIEDFVARKHGRSEITYLHPDMKAALENTSILDFLLCSVQP